MAAPRNKPTRFAEALQITRIILESNPLLVEKGSIESEAEQLVIFAHAGLSEKSMSRLELFSRLSDPYPEEAGSRLLLLAEARAAGKPLQHLTGRQAFLDHEYAVGPDVLIPRPETEVLVTRAIDELKRLKPRLGLEIGAGSGVISIELLHALPGLQMLASELTPGASLRAEQNSRKVLGEGAGRLSLIRAQSVAEVLQPFDRVLAGRRADFLISNPPYLGSSDGIEEEVSRHEPSSALFAPSSDLLHFYRAVACDAARLLIPGGRIFMEIAHERSQETRALFVSQGWDEVELIEDLAGRPRVLFATSSRKG